MMAWAVRFRLVSKNLAKLFVGTGELALSAFGEPCNQAHSD